jgi:GTP cyclohydrolase I
MPGKVVNPMKILMSAIGENATQEDKDSFGQRFQDMVKTLFENQDKVIEIIK